MPTHIGTLRSARKRSHVMLARVLHCLRQLQLSQTLQGDKAVNDLLPLAATIGARLKARGETIAIGESSTGGLIAAALLAVPGASAYFLGGAVAYTRQAKQRLLGISDEALAQYRPATEPHALLLARRAREQFLATWGLGETGAAGPTGNRYGDAAGHCCIAISGLAERAITLETGSADRVANMRAFAAAALDLLAGSLGQ
jgi:nicotinamide-nucleotide amidase